MTKTEFIIEKSNGECFELNMSDEELIREVLDCRECICSLLALEYIIDLTNQMGKHLFDDMRESSQKSRKYYSGNRRKYMREVRQRGLKYSKKYPDYINQAIEMMEKEGQCIDVKITGHDGENGKKVEEKEPYEMVYNYINMVANMLSYIQETGGVDIKGEKRIILLAIYDLNMNLRREGIKPELFKFG